ncbi:histidine phosphatase family protein, partial [Chloroflexota bacterium]
MRHGETEWNLVERFRGRADLALNDTGRKQAEAAGLSLNGLSVAAIYASPLRRALETANIISKHL